MAILSRSLRRDPSRRDGRLRQVVNPNEIIIFDDGDDKEEARLEFTMDHTLARSTHRDGSIYTGMGYFYWKKYFHVADRSETPMEAMMLSDPTPRCTPRDGDDDGPTAEAVGNIALTACCRFCHCRWPESRFWISAEISEISPKFGHFGQDRYNNLPNETS